MKVTKIISDIEAIKVLADPMRMRIVHILQRVGQASASIVANELNESASKISYHLKLLEKHGIVELQESKTKGNLIENFYAASARDFRIQHEIRPDIKQQYNEVVLPVIQEIINLISEDLLNLARLQDKNFDSTISYDTYYLTPEEIEQLRGSFLSQLRAYSDRQSEHGRLACNLGFLLLDKKLDKEDPNE